MIWNADYLRLQHFRHWKGHLRVKSSSCSLRASKVKGTGTWPLRLLVASERAELLEHYGQLAESNTGHHSKLNQLPHAGLFPSLFERAKTACLLGTFTVFLTPSFLVLCFEFHVNTECVQSIHALLCNALHRSTCYVVIQLQLVSCFPPFRILHHILWSTDVVWWRDTLICWHITSYEKHYTLAWCCVRFFLCRSKSLREDRAVILSTNHEEPIVGS